MSAFGAVMAAVSSITTMPAQEGGQNQDRGVTATMGGAEKEMGAPARDSHSARTRIDSIDTPTSVADSPGSLR
ncbi:hypothetical protein [Frankia nepalensis]|uniref:Uncharacterized protein n=1 Tax=Frankia nepalensis TaxID=1836974 RepID=A0A937RT70_9ACTN|nr:hypothetical protein [Frankia nepalensis]MBL7632333.1 hypothetical protein [Frankia nepalensis]